MRRLFFRIRETCFTALYHVFHIMKYLFFTKAIEKYTKMVYIMVVGFAKHRKRGNPAKMKATKMDIMEAPS